MDDQQNEPATTVKPPDSPPKNPSDEFPGAFSLLKPSMHAISLNLSAFLALALIPIGVLGLLTIMVGIFRDSAALTFILVLIGLACGVYFLLYFGPASIYLQIQSARQRKVSTEEALGNGKKYAFKFLGLCLAIGLIVCFGLILLIIPGVILYKRYYLATYYLVDKNLSIGEAMKASATATSAHSNAIWGVIGVSFLFGLIGIIPLIGGLIGGIMQLLYSYAPALRYSQIEKGPASEPVASTIPIVPPKPTELRQR